MNVLRLLIGAAVLFLGRQLYWLFVGAAGFVLGLEIATRVFTPDQAWLIWVIALAGGIIGALLAVFVQYLAVGIAGFVAGGYILFFLFDLLNLSLGRWTWVVYLLGGIIGAVLVLALFDWALIIISSLVGAGMILEGLQDGPFVIGPAVSVLVFLMLVGVGVVVQAAVFGRENSGEDAVEET